MQKDPELIKLLEPIHDPELMMSIVDLGLIYGVERTAQDTIKAEMTFTSPACPVGPQLKAAVEQALQVVEGVTCVQVDIVWTPTWDPRVHCSEDAKMKLGIFE
ncbi:MAG: DUF59 domain-containing protein [Deltaproteobacteria bacterium]|nr:DUF59 domain-containing protein [Deltaproteobacteria bacterium]